MQKLVYEPIKSKKKKKQIKLTRTVQLNHLGPKANHHKTIPLIYFFFLKLGWIKPKPAWSDRTKVEFGLGILWVWLGSGLDLETHFVGFGTQIQRRSPTQCSFL